MKSLAERKKFRAEQRAIALKESGVPNQDTGIVLEGEEGESRFANMTIKELHSAAAELGTEVPKEKTLLADIREYVENYAKFKAQEEAESGNDNSGGDATGWKSGN